MMTKKLKKENVVAAVCTVAALAFAMVFYFWFDPLPLLKGGQEAVSAGEASRLPDAAGYPAGEDIPRISGQEDFEKLYGLDYVTVEPRSIVPTGVWHLQRWADSYESQRRSNGRAYGPRLRKADYRLNKYDLLWYDYNQIYLLGLPDGTYIMAEIPREAVRALERGEAVTLPIGKKLTTGFTETLKGFCEKYGAPTDGVFYAFNDEWQKEHAFAVQVIHIGGSIVLFFIIGVSLILLSNKLLKAGGKKEETL